ncbi:MAG TPA: helix-turn-helix domain-containing protein [Candidatus Pacearchaeota archaeon]|nr:helix-turn-helix domain-containing protein [Candidatus Pacearchaeota archaeon]
MEPIKEAFDRVKQDMISLKEELDWIKLELNELKSLLVSKKQETPSALNDSKLVEELQMSPTDAYLKPTDRQEVPTVPTHNPTDNYPFKPSKAQNMSFSTGNGGVPTDRQTNQQTNQQTQNSQIEGSWKHLGSESNSLTHMDKALEILSSLDSIKKEIRLKFKELTEQEFLVFSAIYQYDEEQGFSDYKTLSQRLGLSESSVRDYVGKLIKKGVPIQKEKINNKQIKLSVSQNLKKVASLDAIIQLRDL